GELHVAAWLRVRLPRDPPRRHRDRDASVAAVRQVLPHLPAPGAARRGLLQGRGRARRAGAVQALRPAVRVAADGSRSHHGRTRARLSLRDARGRRRALSGDLSGLPARAVRARAGRAVDGADVTMAKLPVDDLAITRAYGPHLSERTRGGTREVPDTLVKTHCCFCGQQCGIQSKVKDNEVVGFEPWDDC